MKNRLKSFSHAFRGIRMTIGSEPNMRIHLVIAFCVIIAGIIFEIRLIEWLLCFLCFGLVMASEMVNTAIEKLVDLVSPEFHPIAGKVKDMASGAVLVTAIVSAVVGLAIFLPKIILAIQIIFGAV